MWAFFCFNIGLIGIDPGEFVEAATKEGTLNQALPCAIMSHGDDFFKSMVYRNTSHMNQQWLPLQHAARLISMRSQETQPSHLAANQVQAPLFPILIPLNFSAMIISTTPLLFGLGSSVLGQNTSDVGTVTTSDGLTCPTLPGTSVRDHSKPCTKREGNESYLTLPGTSVRDYSQPGWVHENDWRPFEKAGWVRFVEGEHPGSSYNGMEVRREEGLTALRSVIGPSLRLTIHSF